MGISANPLALILSDCLLFTFCILSVSLFYQLHAMTATLPAITSPLPAMLSSLPVMTAHCLPCSARKLCFLAAGWRRIITKEPKAKPENKFSACPPTLLLLHGLQLIQVLILLPLLRHLYEVRFLRFLCNRRYVLRILMRFL